MPDTYKGLLPTYIRKDLFEDRIRVHGQQVEWYKASKCGCIDPHTGQPKVDISGNPRCQLCHGAGFLYADPIEYVILLQSVVPRREFAQWGTIKVGDLVASIPEKVKVERNGRFFWDTLDLYANVAENDLFVLKNVRERFSEVLVKGSRDRVRAGVDVELMRLYTTDDVINEYAENTHFTFGTDGTVTWLGDPGVPPDGAVYVVEYTGRPSYVVWQALAQPRNPDLGLMLPKRLILRRRDRVEPGDLVP